MDGVLTMVGGACVMQKNAHVVTIDSYEDVPVDDEKSLQKAVANQPVSVAIEAAGRAFQFYDSVMMLQDNGILLKFCCHCLKSDHLVQYP